MLKLFSDLPTIRRANGIFLDIISHNHLHSVLDRMLLDGIMLLRVMQLVDQRKDLPDDDFHCKLVLRVLSYFANPNKPIGDFASVIGLFVMLKVLLQTMILTGYGLEFVMDL